MTSIRSVIGSLLGEKRKRRIRTQLNGIRRVWAKHFRRYGGAELQAALSRLGVAPTDTLLVHANFRVDSGFQGTPNDIVTALIGVVGTHGNLLMVSQPFRGYALDHLAKGKKFDVRRTVSMMGLITEMFRRRDGTRRSLHPTHPVLALGIDADALTAGHQDCQYPCGEGTPFEKLRSKHAKILFFDVGTGANTFFHHVEDILRDELSFPLYDSRLFTIEVIDVAGKPHHVRTYAFARGISRNTALLEAELSERGLVKSETIGNSRLILVTANDVLDVMTDLIKSGQPLIGAPKNGASQ